MPNENRPASKEQVPDPASSYERARPEKEAGMGRMDNNQAVPSDDADRLNDAVKNKQDGSRQLNAHDQSTKPPQQPDHSMHDEEPDGWDMAPTDTHDKRQQRQEGKGGTP